MIQKDLPMTPIVDGNRDFGSAKSGNGPFPGGMAPKISSQAVELFFGKGFLNFSFIKCTGNG